ncbi:hypothetical protein EV421DRAFT_1897955 [Armillaria borealis]|uniref:Uncharacterized protein n=1 Tax=Armillaria borealis TaxID=47425 RepID=A0AA39K3L9_9AGAR|nr:hypothetical protein EV421DRAFT_1897955 [Armillaria borealis]
MPFWLVDVKNIRGNDKLHMSDLIDIDSVSLTAHLNSSVKRTPSPVCKRKQSTCSVSTSPCRSGSPLSANSPVHHTPTQEDCVPSSSDCRSMSLSRSLSPSSHQSISMAPSPKPKPKEMELANDPSMLLGSVCNSPTALAAPSFIQVAVPAIKAHNTLRPPVQWSIDCARAIKNKIVNWMGRRTPQEYVERLFQRFLWIHEKGGIGATFEMDEEEELLQQSLGDLRQCADEIMEQVGVGKGLRCVEAIICDVELIYSWLAKICSEIFYEGREYLIIAHRNYSLMYQKDI